MILVTGASGNVGSAVVDELVALGHTDKLVPATSRAVEPAAAGSQERGDGPAPRHLAFGEPDTYRAAFTDIRALFLVRPPHISNVGREIIPALEAAVAAGVQRIVFLSLIDVDSHTHTPHYQIEQYLKTTDIPWTSLRASFFSQNLLTVHREEIRDRDEIVLPVGGARTSFVDARDIGAVAARELLRNDESTRAWDLTGPEALTYTEVAQILSRELGRDITYRSTGDLRFFARQIVSGRPAMYAAVMTLLYRATRNGSAERVTDTVEQLLGRPAIRLEDFVHTYREKWIGASR